MKAPLVRYLAVIALSAVALVSAQAPAPAASEPTASIGQATGCVEGAKVTKVNLVAADAADTTFTITVERDLKEVFKDADRVVPAGTSEKVSIPDLTYGSYLVRVLAGGDEVLQQWVYVGCPPVGDYKDPEVTQFGGCEGESVFHFSNYPINGAKGKVLPVTFKIRSGATTVYTVTLPDNDSRPYDESVTYEHGDYPKDLTITVDGEELTYW